VVSFILKKSKIECASNPLGVENFWQNSYGHGPTRDQKIMEADG
jgi:hypothetical protein